jgi:amidohydrolase
VSPASSGADRASSPLAEHTAGWLATHTDDLIAWRRHLHRHPELGRQEFATTQFVASHLADAGLNPKVLPGGTGLTCDIGPEGPRVALRADMDALPMAERTGASYASEVPGVAHACGHDGHTAVLLGTALALASAPELPVGVRLIFQPAEELMPGGAIDAVAAGAMQGVSRIYALHCDPRLAVGKVATIAGPITSAADQVEITLQSPGGHTSRPHLTGDLVYALGTLITGVPGVLSRRVDPRNSTIMVWGAVNAGVAANAIPQSGSLAGTIRTASREAWVAMEDLVGEIVAALLAPLQVEYAVNYRRGVPPVVNEDVATRVLTHAIEAIGPDVLADTRQSGGGEDFSWYLEEAPGAMARLGVWSGQGPQLDLHQPTFDLDERALAVGVRVMTNIVVQSALL